MAGLRAGRWATSALALLLLLASDPRPAQAVEAFDGRIQLHGFYEMQVRGLNRDFAEEFDLAQWYHVINLELEFDILPDGWGPFDLLQAYVRAEGRYDCIYVSGCGMFPSAKTYGNKSRDLPLRLRDGVDDSWSGTIQVNEFETPPGLVPIVPVTGPAARDPVPWGLLVLTPTPLGDKGPEASLGAAGPFARDKDPCLTQDIGDPGVVCTRFADPEFEAQDQKDRSNSPLFFDPSIPNFKNPQGAGANPTQALYGDVRTYFNFCSVNYLPNSQDQRLTCIDNRPEKFEVAKRQAFPGFDTLFDQGGADREIGDNPDYATVANLVLQADVDPVIVDPDFTNGELDAATSDSYWDPDGEVPDGAEIRTQFTSRLSGFRQPSRKSDQDLFRDALYGPLFRGIAQLRDDAAFYTFKDIFDWRFTFRSFPGGQGGGGQVLPMGPWLPKNFFDTNAALADRANAFRGRRSPTYIFSEFVDDPLTSRRGGPDDPPIMDQDSRRLGGIRYHELDDGTLDENGNPVSCLGSGGGPGAVDCDPVDDRIQKVEALTLSYAASGLQQPLFNQTTVEENLTNQLLPYPNNPFLKSTTGARFGGDFSGVIPCYTTANSLRVNRLGELQRFDRQILGYGFQKGCVPYTNIQVTGGEGELPFRAAPDRSNLEQLDQRLAQGLFFPSAGLVRSFDKLDYDPHEFNISQIERSFNRGASQQDTYELKEAYADMEFFDSRLWIRAGLQNIVWGKTELFRTTDQFNPQDLALASLPSLEESRIALLSARAVWSFYDVGPLEDVRLELAANFDRFKPADLGGCGEPYTIDVICALTLGTAIHSVTGIGISGVDRPPNGWDDVDGVEFGGRIEFRWDRFSFAITDFYGYNDFPYPEPVFFYDRSIDLSSGRPVKALAKSGCTNGAGILVQNPFRNPVAFVEGDDAFNQGVTKLVHAGTPAQYDSSNPDAAQYRTTGERELDPNELYADGNTIYDNGQPFPSNPVELGDPNEELARVGANDDYWRRLEAGTILGAGIDPGCLKPGGPAGGVSENRFDERKVTTIDAFPRYSNPDTDEVTDVLSIFQAGDDPEGDSDTFINATYGQWQREGFSVDPALALHPANQQLFHFVCSGTVGIAVALTPSACAWNLFGTPRGFLAGTSVGFVETVSVLFAGEPSFQQAHGNLNTIVGATKSARQSVVGGSSPLVSLNSDIRDGRTDAVSTANNIGGERIANWSAPGNAGAPLNTRAPLPSTGRHPADDCPSATRFNATDPDLSRGTCLKTTARDPWDYLELGNTLTMEQKALLGCGPFYGTRCGSAERVLAIRYLRDQFESGPRINVSAADPTIIYPAVSTLSVAGGTYDVAGVLVAEGQKLFEPKEPSEDPDPTPDAAPIYVEDIGSDNPRTCDLDDLDPCTVFGEGGGMDFLNMEGVALIQAFPGIEGTTLGGFYEGDADTPGSRTWVPGVEGDARTYSLDPQPGTLGIPGLTTRVADPDAIDPFLVERLEEPIQFRGGNTCVRYDPGNPSADSAGLVKLPGCRGAVEVQINDHLQTVDVVFERGYTPRQDGCIFQRAVRLSQAKTRPDGSVVPANSFYYVRPVIQGEFDMNSNQLLDVDLANELAETCWNGGAYANVMGADIQIPAGTPGSVWRDGVDPRTRQPTEFYVDKTSYVEGDIGNETVRNPKQYDPTFFSYTRRQIDCPRGDLIGGVRFCSLSDIQLPSNSAGNLSWSGLPTATLYSIRNTRNTFFNPRDARSGTGVVPSQLGQGARNINELYHLSPGLNANGTVREASIIGSGTLFHPFAMCPTASFRNVSGGGQQRWEDPEVTPDTPLACNFRIRDYENDLLHQNAQVFQNEMAAFSWNFMQFLVVTSCNNKSGSDNLADPDCFDPDLPWATDRCSQSTPHICRNVKGFLAVNGVGRNDVRAGGNSQFGRRQFIWHSGGEVALRYKRRNVFGVSADFAEDFTKTNWGMEFTYIGKVPFIDNDSFTNVTDSSAVNLTVSVDRPTFINFLNANRTFFMNTQWFFQYLPGHEKNFTSNGPFNALFTFAVFTGYYQDRLLPQFVTVYDFNSQSGGFLPQLSYRFTESFSMTFGVSWFVGRKDYVTMPINGIAPVTNRAGKRAYQNGNEQFLNLIQRRDEAFLRIRWTF